MRRQSAAVALYDSVANELSCAEYVSVPSLLSFFFFVAVPCKSGVTRATLTFLFLRARPFVGDFRLHVDHLFSQLSQLVERLGPATVVLPAHLKVPAVLSLLIEYKQKVLSMVRLGFFLLLFEQKRMLTLTTLCRSCLSRHRFLCVQNNDGLCAALAAGCPALQTQSQAAGGPGDDADLMQTEGLCFFPGREFTLDAARDRLSVVLVSGMPRALSSRERLAFLASAIDLESTLAWCAAGGLLAFLQKHDLLANVQLNTNPPADTLNDEGVASDDGCCVLYLNAIRRLPLDSVMRISGSTLRALHVFKSQAHPRMLGAGRSKEGLSLFSRLNRTKSGGGARLLRSWIQAPSTSVSVIRDRQRAVKALADPANCGLAHTLSRALKNVKSVATIVSRYVFHMVYFDAGVVLVALSLGHARLIILLKHFL